MNLKFPKLHSAMTEILDRMIIVITSDILVYPFNIGRKRLLSHWNNSDRMKKNALYNQE